jgi:hypothetical protein
MNPLSCYHFSGKPVTQKQLLEIKEIVATCKGLSRTELANTVCELFGWKRPTGKLKSVECRQFLERLATQGLLVLPPRQSGRPKGSGTKVKRTSQAEKAETITGTVRDLAPLVLSRVSNKAQRDLWYEYVDRYHYLGYQLPFGAQLRYFVKSRQGTLLGCLQFSSSAWKMAARERFIGWSDQQRKRNLQKVVNNSRFLIFPWVKVKNLASSILAMALRSLPDDWQAAYGYRPVLIETLVDKSRFTGTCYKAANWIHVGVTTGRGRMDREHARHGKRPKDIYVYPISTRFREQLTEL